MKYIFITGDIHPIGGMQLLVAGKAEILESQGWEVYIFFPTHETGACALASLDKYNEGGFCELTLPPYKWTARTRKNVIEKMCRIIGSIKEEEIIIESHSDRTSQWGEILAAKIHAKHMLLLCNETYRGKDKYYLENLDFYDFKHRRKEVAGEMDDIIFKLFEGYKTVPENEIYIFKYDENPIRDVNNEKVNAIKKYDWNIGYIGRIEKGYVPNIIKSIAIFAKDNPHKSIQFVIVGNIEARRGLIEATFDGISNLTVTLLDDVVPIPKSLFMKLDVVIAGSGSAKCAAYENVYTIIADASNFQANGVLGYDTNDQLYHRHVVQTSFDKALENVLIKKKYDSMKNILPPYMGPEECTAQNFELIQNSNPIKEYYPEEKICAQKSSYFDALCMRIYDWSYKNTPKLSKIMKQLKNKMEKGYNE